MKKVFMMAVLAAFVSTPAMALPIKDSKHDMIAMGFAVAVDGAATEICIFCHTPHSAQASVTQAPLWNQEAAVAADLVGVYDSPTTKFKYTTADIAATDALLCLGCHDTGALGTLTNPPNVGSLDPVDTAVMSPDSVLGLNMSNDHPIGMDVTANPEANSGLHTLDYISGNSGGFGTNPFRGDNNTTMWCSSCHNVHNNEFVPFLRKDNAGSALCKACHIK